MKKVAIMDKTPFGLGCVAAGYLQQYAADGVVVKWSSTKIDKQKEKKYRKIFERALAEDHVELPKQHPDLKAKFVPDLTIVLRMEDKKDKPTKAIWNFGYPDSAKQVKKSPTALSEQIKKDMLIFISKALDE
jgi:asparagine synthetase B (glutamine-hydrolysing)